MALRRILAFVALCTCSVVASAEGAAPPPDPPAGPVDFQWGVKIPLRDGVKLNATLYRPQERKARCRACSR